MLEFLLQLFGEFLIQAIGEALFELGLRSVTEPFRPAPHPWIAAVGYAVFGASIGGASLLIVHRHLVPPGPLRLLNLGLTPVAIGAMMTGIGAWRARRGDPVLRIDRFAYGYVFALAFGAVRYAFAA